jgi:dienelactone hydrolase
MIIKCGEFTDLPVPNAKPMRPHIFRPAAGGHFPRRVLFSEIYQATAPIRRLAAMVAGLGSVVAVADGYSRKRRPRRGRLQDMACVTALFGLTVHRSASGDAA